MGRQILAVVVAMIVAVSIITLGEMLSLLWVPISPGKNPDPDTMRTYYENLPVQASLFLAAIYAVAAFAGGFIATKMGRRWSQGMTLALIVGILLLIAGLVNFLVLVPYHRAWVTILCLLVSIPFALLGYRLARLPSDVRRTEQHV